MPGATRAAKHLRPVLFAFALFVLTLVALPLVGAVRGEIEQGVIPITNPRTLGVDHLPAERIAIGSTGDYKPCIALLKNGDLAIIAFQTYKRPPDKVYEPLIWFRSTDGGRTWSESRQLDLPGAEAYLWVLKDGTIFITAELSQYDVQNTEGYTYSFLHRSTDNGETWESTRILCDDLPGAPSKAWTLTSRNLLEQPDGTLLLLVAVPKGINYVWRSTDRGVTWQKDVPCRFEGVDSEKLYWPFMSETFLWQADSGDILGIVRINEGIVRPLPGAVVPPQLTDQYNRLVLFRSQDNAQSWKLDLELGSYYGEMYPAVLRLKDKRLLLTFTVRAVRPPLGVHAVLGQETRDGFKFDFEHDRLVLDSKTPLDKTSGGGFGPTVQLADETLVAAYTYRGDDDQTHLEVVRWKMP